MTSAAGGLPRGVFGQKPGRLHDLIDGQEIDIQKAFPDQLFPPVAEEILRGPVAIQQDTVKVVYIIGIRGAFKEDPALQARFLELVRSGGTLT